METAQRRGACHPGDRRGNAASAAGLTGRNIIIMLIADPATTNELRGARRIGWVLPIGRFSADVSGLGVPSTPSAPAPAPWRRRRRTRSRRSLFNVAKAGLAGNRARRRRGSWAAEGALLKGLVGIVEQSLFDLRIIGLGHQPLGVEAGFGERGPRSPPDRPSSSAPPTYGGRPHRHTARTPLPLGATAPRMIFNVLTGK